MHCGSCPLPHKTTVQLIRSRSCFNNNNNGNLYSTYPVAQSAEQTELTHNVLGDGECYPQFNKSRHNIHINKGSSITITMCKTRTHTCTLTHSHTCTCMHTNTHAHTRARTHAHTHTHMDSQLPDKHTVSNFLCYYDCNYNNNTHLECTLLNDALCSMKEANLNIYPIMHSMSLRHYLHTHIRC